ncbi:MAG: phenylacetate--CoA ligase family protein [Candidatus Lokiarchaeia archaeon]
MQGEKIREYYNHSIETTQRAELRELQTKLLKYQIKYVFNFSRIEHRKFLDAGVSEETVKTLDDLKKVPIIRKDEIKEEIGKTNDPFGGTMCIPEDASCVIIELFDEIPPQTDPLYQVLTKNDCTNMIEMFARYCSMIGMKRGDRMITQGAVDFTETYVHPLTSECIFFSPTVSKIFKSLSLGLTDVMPRAMGPAVDGVKSFNFIKFFKPAVLFITPELLKHMAVLAEAEGISPRDMGVKIIVYPDHNELLKPSMRKELMELWDANVFSMLCVPEVGFHAIDCREFVGLHVWEDMFIVEAVEASSDEPVSPGETGKLTITNLFAKGNPFIRYKTNIDVELKEDPCACGRSHIRLLSQNYKEG